MIEVQSVNKSYGKKQVLFNLDFEFGYGVYGLLGPNGAGKSTLLQIMTGNLSCDKGEVRYNGRDIRKNPGRYKRRLGYVPQLQGMYETFTAYQFLDYMCALKGIPKQWRKREIMRVLKVVDLTERAGSRLSAYSGGMKQRILIAQALLGKPDVLILDEPTAGLDPRERIRIRNYISRISEKKTIIIATHVVSDVDTIAKEILLLGNGRIMDHGSVGGLCERMKGTVYECTGYSRNIAELEKRAVVSNIQERSDGMSTVRVIARGELPDLSGWRTVKAAPNLQEVYLAAFAEQKPGEGQHVDTK